MSETNNYQLRNNSRFYVLCFSILLSLWLLAWLRLEMVSDQLFYIRLQQIFGLVSILYWYLALLISPLCYAFGKQRLKQLVFARRAIGVSALYFALLHASFSLWGQLGGLSQLPYLPPLFKWSLAGGACALLILLAMAATSFDKIIAFMSFRKWKWLHRFVYLAGVLVIVHIWSIGTHLVYFNVQLAALGALVVLSGLESYRIVNKANQKYFKLHRAQASVVFVSLWVVVVTLLLMIPAVVDSYHSRHVDGQGHAHGSRQESP